MAEGRTLQRLIVLSRPACVALAIVAVAVAVTVPTKHQVGASQNANSLMAVALSMQAVGVPCFLCVLHTDRRPPPSSRASSGLSVGSHHSPRSGSSRHASGSSLRRPSDVFHSMAA